MWERAGLVLGPSGGGTRMICVWASQVFLLLQLEGGGEENGDNKVTVCFLMLQEHGSSRAALDVVALNAVFVSY